MIIFSAVGNMDGGLRTCEDRQNLFKQMIIIMFKTRRNVDNVAIKENGKMRVERVG